MIRRIVASSLALCLVAVATVSNAATIQLGLNVDTVAKTWTVTAQSTGADNLGLIAYSLDVLGTVGGVSIGKAATPSQTNAMPSSVYGQLRTTGTVSGVNLTGLSGSQDAIGAVNNNDDSGLKYGDGIVGSVNGQFIGAVNGSGIVTIARGTFTNEHAGDIIKAIVTPSSGVWSTYPLNWSANTTPSGSAQSGQATQVTAAPQFVFPVPEPSTIALACFGCVGLLTVAKRRKK